MEVYSNPGNLNVDQIREALQKKSPYSTISKMDENTLLVVSETGNNVKIIKEAGKFKIEQVGKGPERNPLSFIIGAGVYVILRFFYGLKFSLLNFVYLIVGIMILDFVFHKFFGKKVDNKYVGVLLQQVLQEAQ